MFYYEKKNNHGFIWTSLSLAFKLNPFDYLFLHFFSNFYLFLPVSLFFYPFSIHQTETFAIFPYFSGSLSFQTSYLLQTSFLLGAYPFSSFSQICVHFFYSFFDTLHSGFTHSSAKINPKIQQHSTCSCVPSYFRVFRTLRRVVYKISASFFIFYSADFIFATKP